MLLQAVYGFTILLFLRAFAKIFSTSRCNYFRSFLLLSLSFSLSLSSFFFSTLLIRIAIIKKIIPLRDRSAAFFSFSQLSPLRDFRYVYMHTFRRECVYYPKNKHVAPSERKREIRTFDSCFFHGVRFVIHDWFPFCEIVKLGHSAL